MTELAQRYHALTLWLSAATGQSDTVLHIHAGMAVLVIARLVTKRSFGSLIPLAFVVAAELANEVLDRVALGNWMWGATAMDLLNTLFWPLALSLGVRWRPMIIRDQGAAAEIATPRESAH